MLLAQINHNPDLLKLYQEGYELEITPSYIILHHIPYIADNKSVMYGSIASSYRICNDSLIQKDHTAYFCGGLFHSLDFTPLESIINSKSKLQITDTIHASYYLSSKPECGKYSDFYEKFSTYVKIISAPASILDPNASPLTYNHYQILNDEIFNYPDIAPNIEGFTEINRKLENLKVAIVGVGGTGSYILDFLSKTRVKEIHLFDGDYFMAHNAYRAPGAPSINQLKSSDNKCDYFETIYSQMRKGIHSHPYSITPNNIHELSTMDFVFVNVDNGPSKKIIHDFLCKNKIPFIDTGIGMGVNQAGIYGCARTTLFCNENSFSNQNSIDYSTNGKNDYQSNLQIVEFNALNACFAIIRFKQFFLYYSDNVKVNSTHFSIVDMETIND